MSVKWPNPAWARLPYIPGTRIEHRRVETSDEAARSDAPADSGVQSPVRAPLFGEPPAILETRLIRDIPLDKLVEFPPERKILMAEQLFNETDLFHSAIIECISEVLDGNSDIRSVLDFLGDRLKWFRNVELAIRLNMPDDMKGRFMVYRSSFWQPLSSLFALKTLLAEESPDLEFMLTSLRRAAPEHLLADSRGYRSSHARKELARSVAFAFVKNALHSAWNENRFIVTVPDNIIDSSLCKDILNLIEWPPNPNDPVLQAFQRVLGWMFDIEDIDGGTVVAIDFGESYYEAENG